MIESALLRRFTEVARQHANRPAIVDARGEVSFQALYDAALGLSHELSARCVVGERVALLAPPSRDWFTAFWGILLSGASVVPLADVHPDAEHVRALSASRARALLWGGGLGSGLSQSGAAREVEFLDLDDLLLAGARALSAPAKGALGDDSAVVFFTSGTTGAPKAAPLSHDQLAHMARLVARAWRVDESDRLVHCLPLHHMHGLGIAYLVCQLAGASVHLLGAFEAHAVWEALDRGTVLMAVPTIHKKLLDAFEAASAERRRRWQNSARALRLITSGSAALPAQIARGWLEIAGKIPLERFGMTEVGVALSNPLDTARVLGSAGQPLPGMDVRIVDEAGHDVPPGEAGELWIRGPSVFSGYDEPAQTREAFSRDGWFKSGDTATWLDDGFVKILGRTSVDIIKSGGYKLSALEIEEHLRAHPLVDDAAVVGVPDLTWGECVVATVVVSGSVGEAELRDFLRPKLAPYKVPKRILMLDELPKNVMGKVDKRSLMAYVARRLGGERGGSTA